MYWAYVLQSQLKKHNEKKDKKSPTTISMNNKSKYIKSPDNKPKDNNCGNCGQNPYFCQCLSNLSLTAESNI